MSVTLQRCLSEVDQAVELVGTYRFFDRHASEAIDCQALVKDMADMNAAEVTQLLVALVSSGHTGRHLAESLISRLDDRDDFDDMYAPELEGLY